MDARGLNCFEIGSPRTALGGHRSHRHDAARRNSLWHYSATSPITCRCLQQKHGCLRNPDIFEHVRTYMVSLISPTMATIDEAGRTTNDQRCQVGPATPNPAEIAPDKAIDPTACRPTQSKHSPESATFGPRSTGQSSAMSAEVGNISAFFGYFESRFLGRLQRPHMSAAGRPGDRAALLARDSTMLVKEIERGRRGRTTVMLRVCQWTLSCGWAQASTVGRRLLFRWS